MTLKFAVPGTGAIVVAPAVVRWCREARGLAHSVGVEFTQPIEGAEQSIRRYIAWFAEQHDA